MNKTSQITIQGAHSDSHEYIPPVQVDGNFRDTSAYRKVLNTDGDRPDDEHYDTDHWTLMGQSRWETIAGHLILEWWHHEHIDSIFEVWKFNEMPVSVETAGVIMSRERDNLVCNKSLSND